MIAKPLTQFTSVMEVETSNIAKTMGRSLLFNPVVGKKTITPFNEKNRTSSFEKPNAKQFMPMRRFKRKQRKVSFSSQLQQSQDAPDCHSETCSTELWHSHFDFQRFLKSAHQEAKTILISDDEEYLNGVDQSHAIAIRLAESVNKNIKDETLLSRISARLDMNNTGLAKWCQETPHRGLERIASKQLRHSKHYIRREIKGLVLSSKGEDDAISVVSYGSTSTSGTGKSSVRGRAKHLAADSLAQRYEQRTKESRLFARMMGLADELAAQKAYQTEEDEELFIYR